MIDVTALGEALIDMTPIKTAQGKTALLPNPGGAPLNVLAMLSRLGRSTAFIGKVGLDPFGLQLKKTAEEAGIQTRGLIRSPRFNTTLAIVQLTDAGDRSFTFYREGCADVNLEAEEVDLSLIDDCRIFHFGSLSLTDEPARSATETAVRYAKARGKLISYDPNYRPLLWSSEETARRAMQSLLPLVDILKVSEEELILLTGERDLGTGAARLLAAGPNLVLVTLGEAGSYFKNAEASGYVPTIPVEPVDTTGCGDAFLGAFLAEFLDTGLALGSLTPEMLRACLAFANCAGALTAQKPGAIPALPDEAAIRALAASLTTSQ